MVISCFLKVHEFNFIRLNEFTTQLRTIIEKEFYNKITLNEIKLPTTKKKFTVLNSPHVHKKAREQFELCTYKRLYYLKGPADSIKDILSIIENLGQDFSIKLIKE